MSTARRYIIEYIEGPLKGKFLADRNSSVLNPCDALFLQSWGEVCLHMYGRERICRVLTVDIVVSNFTEVQFNEKE